MSAIYDELLSATIGHLETLQAQGVQFVAVSPERFQALSGKTPGKVSQPVVKQISSQPSAPRVAPAGVRPSPDAALSEQKRAVEPSQVIRFSSLAASEDGRTPPASLTPAAKEAAMAELRTRALACVKCPNLVAARRNVVFGVGNIHSPVIFVGEAPGADEDAQGEPFVGKAGQLLTRMIQAMELSREQVYIANVLKCRPDTPGQSFGNRKPTPDEMKTCLPYLSAQIDLIQPRVIVALGATAVEGLLGLASAGITRMRGNWQDFRGTPVMPTFHPSFLLRPENAPKKRLVWEDMLQVMERLELPITEKQRNFFLKPGA